LRGRLCHSHTKPTDAVAVVEHQRTTERGRDLKHVGSHAVAVIVDEDVSLERAFLAGLANIDPDFGSVGVPLSMCSQIAEVVLS
jgi:hypothetical protein